MRKLSHYTNANSSRRDARRLYAKESCKVCGRNNAELHHIDGNPFNNEPGNITFLCRKHHMSVDGRLAQVTATAMERMESIKGSKVDPKVHSEIMKKVARNSTFQKRRIGSFRRTKAIQFAMRYWFEPWFHFGINLKELYMKDYYQKNRESLCGYQKLKNVAITDDGHHIVGPECLSHAEEIRCNRYRNKPPELSSFKIVERLSNV